MQRRSTLTILRAILVSVVLSLAGCAGSAPAPDFRILERPPIMTKAAEEQAVQADGTPLAEFGWACLSYSAYISDLRNDK